MLNIIREKLVFINLWIKKRDSKYFIVILAYFLWVTFMDEDNLMLLFKMRKDIKQYENSINFLKVEIEKLEQNKFDIVNNLESAEKFARENYYMKKEHEDIYIIQK